MRFLPSLRREVKDLQPAPQLNDRIPAYPVPPGQVGRPFRDEWDVIRAVDAGLSKSIWVFAAVRAIAQNAAKLPIVMRQGNPIDGPEIDHPILDLFNYKSSMYESAYAWRIKLSMVVLLNRQGAFIQVIYNRLGDPIALYLLPPGYTWPIPNEQTFVSAYRVQFPGKGWYDVPAENVIWLRYPHPIMPYSGLSPMEAAGLSVEADYYAKLYNRNFLINDQRPGGLLLVNGDIDEDSARELRRRFGGTAGWGAGGAGRLTVMEGSAASYVDTSQTARDAQYAELKTITKNEILEAFGVPESAIGNASEKTFANADAEIEVFWRETMLPHLELLARGFDALDPDPRKYLGFDLSRVHVLQRDIQEKRAFMLTEVDKAISKDEYRMETGRQPVGGGASKLYNPINLAEVADTTPVDHPLTDRNPPDFDPAVQSASVEARLALEAKDDKDIGGGGPSGPMAAGIDSSSPVGGNPMGLRPIQRGDVVVQPQRDPLARRRRRKRPGEPDEVAGQGKAPAPAPGRKSASGITFSPLRK